MTVVSCVISRRSPSPSGLYGAARPALEEANARAEASGDLQAQVEPLILLSLVYLRRGEMERSTLYCERGLALAGQLGYLVQMTAATARRGIIA